MQRAIAGFILLGCLTGAALAQDTKARTVVGCLQKVRKGEFVIVSGGSGLKQYRVTSGDLAKLGHLQEHTVRVTGMVGESDPNLQVITPPNAGSTTGSTYYTIDANQVQDITSNCSEFNRKD